MYEIETPLELIAVAQNFVEDFAYWKASPEDKLPFYCLPILVHEGLNSAGDAYEIEMLLGYRFDLIVTKNEKLHIVEIKKRRDEDENLYPDDRYNAGRRGSRRIEVVDENYTPEAGDIEIIPAWSWDDF